MIRKRLLSFFTAFALMLSFVTMLPDRAWAAAIVAEPYDLWVSGVRVDPYNCNNILGDNEASYDPAGKVLTLKKDITSTGDGGVTIDSRIEGLTVKAEKDVTISRPGFGAAVCIYEDTTITGKMTLTGGAGIMAVGCDLTIDSADLDIVGSGWGIYGGLQSDTKLTINNSSIRASGEEGAICGFSEGIMLYGCGILTTDCSVREGCISEAYSNEPTPVMAVEITTADIYELEIAGKKVTSANCGDILGGGEASYDLKTNTLTLKKDIICNKDNTEGATSCITNRIGGLTVKAENEVSLTREEFGACISTFKDITLTGKMNLEGGVALLASDCQIIITDADLTVIGHNGSAAQGGMLNGTNTSRMTINNSDVRFSGAEDGSVVNFGNGIELNGCNILQNECTIDNGSFVWVYDSSPYMEVEVTTADIYGLEVAGAAVTSRNCGDILGNGEASYDPETKTLTLKKDITCNAENTEGATPCITNRIGGLTVKAEGEITLIRENFGAAIYSEADMTLTGKMNVSGGAGILVTNSTLTIKDAEINVTGNAGAIQGGRFGAESGLIIDSSKVNAVCLEEGGAVTGFGKGIELIGCELTDGALVKDGSVYASDGKTAAMSAETEPVTEYGVKIIGIPVTDRNCKDILGNGAVEYDPEKNMLIIRDNIWAGDEPALWCDIPGLTVKTEKALVLYSEAASAAVFSADTTMLTNGTLTAESSEKCCILIENAAVLTFKDSDITAYGLYGIAGSGGNEKLTVNNSYITAEGETWAVGNIGGGITLTDSTIVTPEGGLNSNGSIYNSDGTTRPAKVEITADKFDKYELEVCGVQATSLNCRDILGGGEVSYDAAANTLTVNKDLTSGGLVIDNRIKGLTLKTTKAVTLTSVFLNGIMTSEDMTVVTNGKLTLSCNLGGFVLKGDAPTLTIKDSEIAVSANWGIIGDDESEAVIIENSTVTVDSKSYAIGKLGAALTLKDCYIKTPEGGSISGNVILDARGGLAKEVRIAPPAAVKKGDVNGDGVVDLSDYADLAKYFAEWSGYDKIVNVQAADLNGSGGADLDDLSILAKYLAEWSGYEDTYFK